MTYVLIFWSLWSVPYTHWETLTLEPLYSVAECEARAEAIWERVQADGAVAWKATCTVSKDMEA